MCYFTCKNLSEGITISCPDILTGLFSTSLYDCSTNVLACKVSEGKCHRSKLINLVETCDLSYPKFCSFRD